VIGLVRHVQNRKQALALLEERLRSINQGTYKPSSVLTFREFALEKWEPAILPTLQHSTQRDYRSLLRRHLLPVFGDKRLCDLHRAEVQLFLTEKGKQLATKSVHHLRVLLSRILGVAVEWGFVPENVARGTKLPNKAPVSERPFLTIAQTRQLLAGLDGLPHLLVLVAVLTGLRRGELFGLRWKYVDFDRRLIHVRESLYEGRFGLPKTKSSVRDVPMSETLYSALEEHREAASRREPNDLVFCDGGGQPLKAQEILEEVIYPVCDKAELPRIGWHAFRHTNATLLGDLGESIKTTQALLGHSDLGTTLSVYTHAVPESQRRAVTKLDRVLFPTVPNFAAASELTH
jgi:integrase